MNKSNLILDDALWNTFDDAFNIKSDDFENDMNDDIHLEYGCNNCKTLTLMYQDGNHCCVTCGEIQKKRLSHEAEYRFYGDCDNKSTNPERVGLPTNYMLPESSLGSLIKQRPNDNSSIKRMVQYNTWHQMPYKERSLYKICCKIATCCKIHGLPTIIIERAKEFYNIIREVNISRGDNRDGIIAACVYFACKDEKVPRSSKEIADMFSISVTSMTKGCKRFMEIINLNKIVNNKNINLASSGSTDFVHRFCSKLNMNKDLTNVCLNICTKAEEYSLVSENTPPSIAAGTIYLVSMIYGLNLNKKTISQSCKISEVTICKCYKRLKKYYTYLLPKDILDKINKQL